MKKKYSANSPDELVPVARELIRLLKPWSCDNTASSGNSANNLEADSALSPTLIFLSGPLGAGKTKFVQTFVQEAARFCGSHRSWGAGDTAEIKIADVSSPTFALQQQYRLPGNQLIHHFDLYRVESEDEVENVGLWDVLGSRQGVVFVEWPEKLPGFTDPIGFAAPGWFILLVRFEVLDRGVREIKIQTP